MAKLRQRGRSRKAWEYLTGVWFCCTLWSLSALANDPSPSAAVEAQLRAAVTVGVLRFTSWYLPKTSGSKKTDSKNTDMSRVQLCLVGRPVSEPFLLPVDGETRIGTKQLSVRRARKKSWLGCQVFVIGVKARKSEVKKLFDYALKQHVLTVCDGCSESIASRTMIQLKLDQRRIKFDVNLAQVNAAAIRLDASLLELASMVRKK